MTYDFDSVIDRHGTACLKFDFAEERHRPADALSYWVADMDFPTAPEVIDALSARVANGIFGYTDVKPPYFEAVQAWYRGQFGYTVQRPWLVVTPGVVFALALAVQAFTSEGDGVLIQNPVYYPFSETVIANRRTLVVNPLRWKDGRYEIDFADFERKVASGTVKLFLLCNPHNPGGRSWTRQELSRLAELCAKHNVVVFSDEIHSDFVWQPAVHTVFASVSPAAEALTVTATAPTKSFNLAGLQLSNIFVANDALRAKYRHALDAFGYSQPATLGLTACEAAYRHGKPWLDAVRRYLTGNIDRAVRYINDANIGITAYKPEATYLVWMDCNGLGLSDRELNDAITHKAKLWLDAGTIFGKEGEGFQRINVATSWAYLEQGLERLVTTLQR